MDYGDFCKIHGLIAKINMKYAS